MKRKTLYLITTCYLILTGCSKNNTGSSGSTTGSLQVTAPSTYIASANSAPMPIIIHNTGQSDISNIKYSFPIDDANVDITNLPNNCNTIKANSSCQINIPISANVKVGSLQVKASTVEQEITSNVIGFIATPTTNEIGANAVLLYANDTVLDSSKVNNLMVTAIIASTNAYIKGSFNNIALVDANKNQINYCSQISGISGESMPIYSVLTYLCNIPKGTTEIDLAPQLQNSSMATNSTNAKSLNVAQNINIVDTGYVQLAVKIISSPSNLPNNPPTNTPGTTPTPTPTSTPSDVRMSNFVQTPSIVSLSESNPTQSIIVSNLGNIADTITKIASSSDNIMITDDKCSQQLIQPNGICSYTLTLNNNIKNSGYDVVQVYTTSSTEPADKGVSVSYQVSNPLIDVSLSPLNLSFNSNALSPVQTKIVTISNNSNITITPQMPVIPQDKSSYFAVNDSNISNYCYKDGYQLAPNQTCSFNVTYTNANNQKLAYFNLALSFLYNDQGQQNYSTVLAINYQTVNFVALEIQDTTNNPIGSINFSNIYNDGNESLAKDIIIYNQGTIPATNLVPSLQANNNQLFNITNNTCDIKLDAGSKCQMTINFGPAKLAESQYNNQLVISYTDGFYSLQSILPLQGTLLNVVSANFTNSTSTSQQGEGTITNPYIVDQNSINYPSIIYTITNTGNLTAESLNISLAPNTGWSISQDQCSDRNLNPSASCNITLQLLNTSSLGSNNLDLSNLTITWTDINTQKRISSVATGVVSVLIVQNPRIVMNMEPSNQMQITSESALSYLVLPNTNYTINFTLTGSSTSHNIAVDIINASGSANISSNKSCSVSGDNLNCQVQFTTANNQSGNGDFSINISSDIPLLNGETAINKINFHTWNGSLPAQTIFTSSNYLGSYKGFIYSAANDNVYRCSALNNGNIYSCIELVANHAYPNVQQIQFAQNYIYMSSFIADLVVIGQHGPQQIDILPLSIDGTSNGNGKNLNLTQSDIESAMNSQTYADAGVSSFAVFDSPNSQTLYFSFAGYVANIYWPATTTNFNPKSAVQYFSKYYSGWGAKSSTFVTVDDNQTTGTFYFQALGSPTIFACNITNSADLDYNNNCLSFQPINVQSKPLGFIKSNKDLYVYNDSNVCYFNTTDTMYYAPDHNACSQAPEFINSATYLNGRIYTAGKNLMQKQIVNSSDKSLQDDGTIIAY